MDGYTFHFNGIITIKQAGPVQSDSIIVMGWGVVEVA